MTEAASKGDQFKSGSPDHRVGVAAKLRNAFIGVSLFSLLSAVVGIVSFQVIEGAQDQVLDRSLPVALGAERVANQGLTVVAATPALLAAGNDADLQREQERILRAREDLRASIAEMRRLGVNSELLAAIEADLGIVFANLELQVELVRARNNHRAWIKATAVKVLADAEQLIETLKPRIVEASTDLLAKSDEIREELSRPGAAERQTFLAFEELADVDFYEVERLTAIRFRAENLINHVDKLLLTVSPDGVAAIRNELSLDLHSLARSALETNPASLRAKIGRSLQELSGAAHGSTNIFELKLGLIGINGQLDQLSAKNRDRADKLQTHADQLLAEVGFLIEGSSEQARETLALGRVLLVAIAAVAFLVAIYVVRKFVLKDVAGRIRRLASITRDLAQGNVDVAVDVSGSDELGEMADAVRVFKSNAAELRRSNSELEQFAYVASHDLKAPLRGVSNLASWIEQDLEDAMGSESKNHMALLHSRVKRMETLLEDLLQYSRVGREETEVRSVDLNKLVPDVFRLVAPPDEFRLTILEPLPSFVTASAPLEKVFRNLIGNAVKHHDFEGGTIEVGVRDLGPDYEFLVRDDGPGIQMQFQERIFAMFQTLKSRDEVEGSGMGLAIVKKSVESLGCAIVVDSNPAAVRGTTFRFSWPKRWRGQDFAAHAA